MSGTDRRRRSAEACEPERMRDAQLVEALGAWADRVRVRELARAERRLRGLTGIEREIVDAVTRQVVGALVRESTERLRSAAGLERARYAEEIRHLFPPTADGEADRGEE